jgi:hypothetical protein
MRLFLSFGGPSAEYNNRVAKLGQDAKKTLWFDQIRSLTEVHLKVDSEFWTKHGEFLSTNERGYGYWLWKPYIIYKNMKRLHDDDILVYADAGCHLNTIGQDRFHEYMKMLEESEFGMICFQLGGCTEYKYTKKGLMQYMQATPAQMNSDQIMASVVMMKKTPHTTRFLEEWYRIASNYSLINDDISMMETSGFIAHRHDQSIYSLLVKQQSDNMKIPSPIIIPDETYFHPNWEKGAAYPIWVTRIRK